MNDAEIALLERAIVGSLINEPGGQTGPNIDQVLERAELMQDPGARDVAIAIRTARSNGGLNSTCDIARYLDPDRIGLIDMLAGDRNVMPLSVAGVEAEVLVHRLHAIDAVRTIAEAHHAAQKDPNSAPRILDELSNRPCRLLVEPLERRLVDLAKPPSPVREVFTLSGRTLCTPGNLTTITAPPKAGKSAVIAAAVASTMRITRDADCLGFWSSNGDEQAVLWFDSEQSPDDAWHCVNRAVKRAGREVAPPWLRVYRLTGMNSSEARQFVLRAIRADAATFGGIHSIFLDGVADFVADVNDAEESNGFVAQLHSLAIKHDCPIVGVLHFNPNSEKSRGHLGSQLERKSESNLKLEKVEGVTVMYSEKQRRAPIPKNSGPCFRWSDEAGMHVGVSSLQELKDEERRSELRPCIEDLFAGGKACRYTELRKGIETSLGISRKAAEKRVAELVRLGMVAKSFSSLYVKAG